MDQQDPSPSSTDGQPGPLAAFLLTLFAPGLALVYTGRLLAGLIVNILFVLVVLLFVIVASVFQFFPLYPAVVLVGTWMVFCALSGWRAIEMIDDGDARRGRGYQHPLLYALIALVTFLAPLAATAHFTVQHLITVVPVEHDAMAPQHVSGDWLVVDRTAFQNEPPTRGDVVVARLPQTGERTVSRVVATPSDHVQMQGYHLLVNDELIEHSRFDGNAPDTVDDDSELWVEHNHDRHYVISVTTGSLVDISLQGMNLGDDQYFLLSDNRSFIDDNHYRPLDSRGFGAVTADNIEGRPLYIGWSPDFDRIGLRPQ